MEKGVVVGTNNLCNKIHFNRLTIQNMTDDAITLTKCGGFYVDSTWLEGNAGNNMTIADYNATDNPGDVFIKGQMDDIDNSAGGIVHTLSRERRLVIEEIRDTKETGVAFNGMMHSRVNLTYSASMTPDPLAGDTFYITITDGVAFTINKPTDIAEFRGARLTFVLINTSGGVIGNVTWAANYKTEWNDGANKPANGERVTISFVFEPDEVKLTQVGGISGSFSN
jgi:hypothetical protein